MSHAAREDLIDSYFTALDEEDPSLVQSSLADSFVYESLSRDFEGYEGFRTYMTEFRSFSNTDHRITRHIHGETATAAEGTVVGSGRNGERVESRFSDMFEFDSDDQNITRLTVYVNELVDKRLFE